jgi:transcriptional regulator with XRE-family HTH domain
MAFRYHDGNPLSNSVTVTGNDIERRRAYPVSSMVTRIGPRSLPRAARRLYIREHRLAAGLTQQQLADRLDTSKATISRIETGSRDFTGDFLDAVAEALGKPSGRVLLHHPKHEADILEKLATAPENLKEQLSTVINTFLAAAAGRK